MYDVFNAFDKAAHQVSRLLRDSFKQFKLTSEFTNLCIEVGKKYNWDKKMLVTV